MRIEAILNKGSPWILAAIPPSLTFLVFIQSDCRVNMSCLPLSHKVIPLPWLTVLSSLTRIALPALQTISVSLAAILIFFLLVCWLILIPLSSIETFKKFKKAVILLCISSCICLGFYETMMSACMILQI